MWVLEKVPKSLLVVCKVAVAKVLLGPLLPSQGGVLLLDVGQDRVPPRVELVHAADVHVDLVDHSELEVVRVAEHGDGVDKVV